MNPHTDQHPIERRDYFIPTKSLEDCVNTIYQWIDTMITGGIIYGIPRIGKTTSIKYMLKNFNKIFNMTIPIYFYSYPDKQTPTENQFYEDILYSVGNGFYNSGNSGSKLRRLVDYLKQEAVESNENKVILFIDEAQWMKDINFNWLMGIHNFLDKNNIMLYVFLFGQNELYDMRANYMTRAKLQIIARFMSSEFKFNGIQSKADLRRILLSFDEGSEYPENSGFSFTQSYLPLAFKNGWRLHNHNNQFWDAFKQTYSDHNIKTPKEILMKPIPSLIRYLFNELSELDSDELELSTEKIKEGIDYVQYINLVRSLNLD